MDPMDTGIVPPGDATGPVAPESLQPTMNASGSLQDPTGESQLSQPSSLPDDVTELRKSIIALEERLVLQETDFDHHAHFYSTQNRQLASQVESLKQQLENEKGIGRQKDAALQSVRQELDEHNAKSTAYVNPALGTKIEAMESEKRELTMIITKRQQEIDRLSEECDGSQQQLQSLRSELRNANNTITSLETHMMRDKLLMSAKDQELIQAKKQSEWLNEELQKKSKEVHLYRLEKTREISETQTQLDVVIQEKSSLESRNRALQQRVEGLEHSVQDLMQKLEERDTRLVRNEHSFKTEMDGQKRLTEIFENNLKDAQEHLSEMQKTLSESQEDWEAEKSQLDDKLQSIETECAQWKEQFDQLYEEADRLRYQLKESVHNRSPNASPRSTEANTLSSRVTLRGMTYTSLYTSFEEEKQRRVELERELEILRDRYAEAYERLEEMNPFLQELEQDNKRLSARHEKLFADLSKALEDKKAAVASVARLETERMRTSNEKRMLEQDIRDLCRQVHSFCIQLQQLRPGAQVDLERYLQELLHRAGLDSNSQEAPTDAMISASLVEVKSVEELVQQNVDLRRVARNLARQAEAAQQQLETQQNELTSTEIATLTAQVQTLEEKLEKTSRQLRYVVKQRNDYKAMRRVGDDTASSPFKDTRAEMSNGQRNGAALSEGDFEKLFRELQKDFDNYARESGTSVKELSLQLDRMREEKSELTIQISKYTHQLSFQQDRYQLLAANADMQMKEISQLREQLAKMAQIASQQDEKKQELTARLMDERLRSEELSSQLQQGRIEREVWESSKNRALKECQELLSERNLANERGRALQRQLEDRDETFKLERKRLEDKLDTAERDLAVMRKQLVAASDENRALLVRKDAEIQTSNSRIQRLTVENEKTKGELLLIKNKEENLSLRLAECTERLNLLNQKNAVYEGRTEGNVLATAEDRCRDLERALAEARKTIAAHREDLERAKEREVNLKELAENSERELLEFNEAYDAYKEAKEQEIAQLQQRIRELDSLRNETLEQMKTTDRDLIEAREKLESERHEHEQNIRSLEAQIERIKVTEDIAVKAQQAMQEDVKRHSEIAQQAKDSYEKEVMAHSKALHDVTLLKKQKEEIQDLLHTTMQQAALLEMNLRTGQKSWEETKQQLEQQISESQSRLQDLQSQNELLHSQFERMQETLKLTDQALEDGATGGMAPNADGSDRVIQELRELVRHARSERDILQTKLDIALSENNRYLMELSLLRNNLDEARARLDEERKKGQDALQDDKRHRELMEKIEQANLLRESNVTLRDQVEQNLAKMKVLEGKLRACESELGPLREQVINLQAEVVVRKEENNSLVEDNKRWKERVDQILRKYQRIDPVDYEKLKQDVERLEAEKQALLAEKAQLTASEDLNKKLRDIMQKQKAFLEARSKQVAELEAAAKNTAEQISQKEKEIQDLRDQLAHPEKNEACQAEMRKSRKELIEKANANISKFRERNALLQKEKQASDDMNARLQTQLRDLQSQLEHLPQAGGTLNTDTAALTDRIQQLESEIGTIKAESDKRVANAMIEWKLKSGDELNALTLRKQLLESQLASEKKRVSALNERLKQLQNELAQLQLPSATPAEPVQPIEALKPALTVPMQITEDNVHMHITEDNAPEAASQAVPVIETKPVKSLSDAPPLSSELKDNVDDRMVLTQAQAEPAVQPSQQQQPNNAAIATEITPQDVPMVIGEVQANIMVETAEDGEVNEGDQQVNGESEPIVGSAPANVPIQEIMEDATNQPVDGESEQDQ
ncbi:hypothetical protein DFJ77DRAFT_465239 [Powellomyces hirtus]|nr:hypothetical protein DFJ77DRAFT_465239 [Powellomyces hirtus]